MNLLLSVCLVASLWAGCQPEASGPAAAPAPQPTGDSAASAPSPAPPPASPAPVVDIDPEDVINYYEVRTPQGRMVIRLYDETPIHRNNFQKLVAEAFFDSTTFHRVIGGFMIQGGDPNSRDDDNVYNDGQGGPGYTLESEASPVRFHKRGALASARSPDHVNPRRRSNGSQFYIVHGGRPFPAQVLGEMEQQLRQQIPDPDFTFSDDARAAYTTDGGAPHLDGMYTVFGEVVEGFDVLDRIAALATPRSTGQQVNPAVIDRPFEEVPMVVRPLPDYTP